MFTKKKSLIEDLTHYIKRNLKKGYTLESLRWALLNQGYSRLEVDRAFKRAEMELAREAPILKVKPIIRHEIVEEKEFKVGKDVNTDDSH